jgi:PhnB protein
MKSFSYANNFSDFYGKVKNSVWIVDFGPLFKLPQLSDVVHYFPKPDFFGGIHPCNCRFRTPHPIDFLPTFVSDKDESMNQIITYLTFSGNCQEAMEFYQNCLGGDLEVQTLSETPEGGKFPDDFKKLVVNASLKKDNMLLMGTDLRDDKLVKGNAVSILVNGHDEHQIREYYSKLEEGATALHTLDESHWGDLFGGLTDRYGHHWLFHCRR